MFLLIKRHKFSMDLIMFVIYCLVIMLINVEGTELEYRISEERPPDTYVGNVATDYDLRSTMTSLDYDSLVYRILTAGNDYASYFRIDEKDGILYTATNIDRDVIPDCIISIKCVLSLDIAIQTQIGAFFRKINVDIIVDDVNDNSPQFIQQTDSVEFSESSVVGTYATINGAIDSDAGNNSVQNYYIATSDVPFDVTLEKYADGRTVVKVVVIGPLDRENVSFYQIKAVAEDGGDPKLTGELIVNVTILDVNDNKPVFDVPFYNVTIPEDSPINKTFLTVSASDPDVGLNGEVEYRLSNNLNDDIRSLFSVNATTGELSVTSQLVSTSNDAIQIYVEAADKGKQPRVSHVLIYIHVEDTSNTAPDIKVNILSGDVKAAVSEYANVGAVVAFIAVSDVDTGRNGKVDCITISDYFALKKLVENEYKVVVVRSLNRELRDQHEVKVICRDNGTPPLNSTADFTVTVLDENDNPPRFSQVTYFPKTEENNRVGDVIARVFADDMDIGQNAKIAYSLYNTNGYDFWIDNASGEIRANFRLDRENISEFLIVVKATDHGEPEMSSTATVKLIVTDQNDNVPVFVQSRYEFRVHEGINLNSTIGQLIATDKDNGENGSITFSFDTIPASNFPFILYSDGTIKMIRTLDRETKNRYEFNVIASDRGLPPLNSSVSVTVIVLDVNDNEPRFVFPNNANNTVEVSLASYVDKVMITVKAIDFDEGVNKDITYSIIDNNFTDMFQMSNEAEKGIVRISRFPGRSDPLKYNLLIKAEDHGNTSLYSVQTLTVIFRSESESEASNFVLAVSFGCATVFLSITIIVTICLIRRRDRNSCNELVDCSNMSKVDFQIAPQEMKQNVTISDTVSQESVKDGGFSPDPDSTWNSDNWNPAINYPFLNKNSTQMTGNKNCQKRCHSPGQGYTPYDPSYQKLDPAALQLHRSLLKAHVQSFKASEKNHIDDNGSEASAETNTVDSGKGSSVSDIMARDIDQAKTVTFADQPMLYRFLQAANYPREKVIPTIPENADKMHPDDINMTGNDKYGDEFIDKDRLETDDINVSDDEKYDYDCAYPEKLSHQKYIYNPYSANNSEHKHSRTKSSDDCKNNSDYMRPPLCNKSKTRDFRGTSSRSSAASDSSPSIYSDSQNETDKMTCIRIQSPTNLNRHYYKDFGANNRSPSQNATGQLSPNSEYGSEIWGSSYVDDDTTTEGSYTIEHIDSPNSAHNHSRSYVLAPNEAYC